METMVIIKRWKKKVFNQIYRIKSCDYSDTYVLVTGNITAIGADNNTKVAFNNCASFRKCGTEINETFVDDAQRINIAMPMYNLIEYSDNYFDTSRSLCQFKRDKIEGTFPFLGLIWLLMLVVFQIIRHHLSINQVLLQTEMV